MIEGGSFPMTNGAVRTLVGGDWFVENGELGAYRK